MTMPVELMQGSDFSLRSVFTDSANEPIDLGGGECRLVIKRKVSDPDSAAVLIINSTDSPDSFNLDEAETGVVVATVFGTQTSDLVMAAVKQEVILQLEVTSDANRFRTPILQATLHQAAFGP